MTDLICWFTSSVTILIHSRYEYNKTRKTKETYEICAALKPYRYLIEKLATDHLMCFYTMNVAFIK